jgi:FAD:protein FMN transferase
MSVFDSMRGVGRREFLAFGAGTFAVAGLPFVLRRRLQHPGLIRRSLPVMGTIAEVAVAHRDVQVAQDAIDAAMHELQWVERTMTRFSDESDIGRANLHAAAEPVGVDAATALVVAEALRWADASDGAYDPAVGRIVRLWDVLNRHEPPPAAPLARLASRQLHRQVEVGSHRSSPVLLFHDPDVAIDLGAIAKGYAVDRAARVLRERGIEKALVEAGGDLYAIGTAPDGQPWQIGVRDPNDTRAIAGTLSASNEAVATSGTYFRFFKWRGRRYHHLMDPEIAEPRHTLLQSLTIRADSCMHADVAATAVFGRTRDDANALLRRVQPGATVVSML